MASFKTRRKIIATGGAEVGSAASYMDFGSDGRQVLVGKAMVYKDLWLPATAWYGQVPNQWCNAFSAAITAVAVTPTVLPKEVYGGKDDASPISVPTLAASCAQNADARAALCFIAPPDAASSGSSTVTLYYTTSDAMTALDMEVWCLRWQFFGSGTSDVGGLSGSILYGASMVSTGSGKLEIQTLGTINAFRSASPFCVLELALEDSNASAKAATPNQQVYGMNIRYIADSLGVQVA